MQRTRVPIASLAAIAAAAACLMASYPAVRSSSASLFLEHWGAGAMGWATAAVPALGAILVALYAWLVARWGPSRTLAATTIASAGALFLLAAGLARPAAAPASAASLYVFKEVYIVLLVEQYWSFINSTVDRAQARWVNGAVLSVSALGSIAAGRAVEAVAVRVGSANLVALGSLCLVPAAILSALAYRFRGAAPQGDGPAPAAGQSWDRRDIRTLVPLALAVFATQAVAFLWDRQWSGWMKLEYGNSDARTAAMGAVYADIDTAALALNLVGFPILSRWPGIGVLHHLLPLVSAFAALALIAQPTLATASAAFISFKALDYSLWRAGKEMLYIPLSFRSRFQAKAVIDVFVYRLSKGSIGLVTGAVEAGGVVIAGAIPWAGLAACAIWGGAIRAAWRAPERQEGPAS